MRTTFIDTLCEVAAADPRVWLICGDLGYSVLEKFANAFPDRYLNAGVAEQNMTGIAAGLAMTGKTVFTYSIANFPVMRCLEQIRNDVAYHNLNVKVVSVGGGLAYGYAGYTHHGVEDLAVMRTMPNMVVAAPGDPAESRAVTRLLAAHNGPCYLRLGKAGEPKVHAGEVTPAIGQGIWLRPPGRITLISTGGSLRLAAAVSDRLNAAGVTAGVLSMPTIQPLDTAALETAAAGSEFIATIEEHGVGGLGSIVAEWLAVTGVRRDFAVFRLANQPMFTGGSQDDLLTVAGLTEDKIATAILSRLSAN